MPENPFLAAIKSRRAERRLRKQFVKKRKRTLRAKAEAGVQKGLMRAKTQGEATQVRRAARELIYK